MRRARQAASSPVGGARCGRPARVRPGPVPAQDRRRTGRRARERQSRTRRSRTRSVSFHESGPAPAAVDHGGSDAAAARRSPSDGTEVTALTRANGFRAWLAPLRHYVMAAGGEVGGYLGLKARVHAGGAALAVASRRRHRRGDREAGCCTRFTNVCTTPDRIRQPPEPPMPSVAPGRVVGGHDARHAEQRHLPRGDGVRHARPRVEVVH